MPLAAPQTAKVVNRPRIFADSSTGAIAGLWQGGTHGPGTQTTALTNQCHDITVFPEIGLAAGACSGNGILLDISRSGQPGAHRPGHGPELRLLALGDVQQRRHQGDLHRRVGRRHQAALPGDRLADLGRQRHLQHRRSASCSSPATTSCRRRRARPRTASRTTARSSRCRDATSWCRRGTRAASRSSTSPIRQSRSRSPTSIAARSIRRS